MAWPKRVRRPDKPDLWFVCWRERVPGKPSAQWPERSRPLGPVHETAARAEARAATVTMEGKRPGPEDTDAETAVSRFVADLGFDDARQDTVTYYVKVLGRVRAMMEPTPLRAWTAEAFKAALRARKERKPGGWSPRTIQMHVYASRRFVKWCQAHGIDCPDFTLGVRGPKVRRRERDHYTAGQVSAAMVATRGHRYLGAAIGLCAYCALSHGDLYALAWGKAPAGGGPWIDTSGDVWWIRGTRRKSDVQVRTPVLAELRALLEPGKRKRGSPVLDMPRDLRAASRALVRALERAGVPTNGGFKRFRHSAATMLMAAGFDLATIGAYLAHSPGSIQTLVYTHADEERLIGAATQIATRIRG